MSILASTELETQTQDGHSTLQPTATDCRKVLTVKPYERYEKSNPSGFDISFGMFPASEDLGEEQFRQIEAIRAASTLAADSSPGPGGNQDSEEHALILQDDELTEWKRIVRESVGPCVKMDQGLMVEIDDGYQVPADEDNPQPTFELELSQVLLDRESYDLMLVEREGREKGLKFHVTPVQVGWTDPDHVEAVSTMMKNDISFQARADRNFGSRGFAYAGRTAEMLSRRIRNESQDTTVRRYPRVVSTYVASQLQGCLLP